MLYKKDGKEDPLEFIFENSKREEKALINNCSLIFDKMSKFGWLEEKINKEEFIAKMQNVAFASEIYRKLKSEYCYGIGKNEKQFMNLIGLDK